MRTNEYAYTVNIESGEKGGFVVSVPALPGCFTQGRTYNEALANAEECIEGFLEALIKAGQPIPTETPHPPLSVIVRVPVPVSAV
ncbi:MAG: type II toxin-antitoxin system HicB family antitoxin [Candidatus Liptonbacteria bacterium]|nr:type II toxin-antitoxin system HicB family antitoxin [Candidatus Liptonbacteria bacterium]